MVRARQGGGKRQPRAALTRGGEDSVARRQCGWLRLALSPVVGRGGGGVRCWLGLAQDGEEMGRERKKGGTGATTPVLVGIGGMEQRRGVSPGWSHMARRWGRGVWGRGAARRSGGNGPRPPSARGAVRVG
jgi:hypothetical protein